jgi:hypothetical protein
MQKTPITIVEDLEALEKQSEIEIQALLKDMEDFFKPVTNAIEPLLNPESDEPEEAPVTAGGPSTRGATGKKDDPKKPPPKAAPAKGKPG